MLIRLVHIALHAERRARSLDILISRLFAVRAYRSFSILDTLGMLILSSAAIFRYFFPSARNARTFFRKLGVQLPVVEEWLLWRNWSASHAP
jgi:hypothetical protein